MLVALDFKVEVMDRWEPLWALEHGSAVRKWISHQVDSNCSYKMGYKAGGRKIRRRFV